MSIFVSNHEIVNMGPGASAQRPKGRCLRKGDGLDRLFRTGELGFGFMTTEKHQEPGADFARDRVVHGRIDHDARLRDALQERPHRCETNIAT